MELSRPLDAVVTLATLTVISGVLLYFVTTGTYPVYLVERFHQTFAINLIVAEAAVLVLVAVDALELEQFDVLDMLECHNRGRVMLCDVCFYDRHGYRRQSESTLDVSRGGRSFLGAVVTYVAGGLVRPLAMTDQALTVIGSLQIRLPIIGR